MKVLVIGGTGRLGKDIVKALVASGHECRGIGSSELDLFNNVENISRYILYEYPCDVIVNCAAKVGALDYLESISDACVAINAEAPRYIARAAETIGAKVVQISTDYVFSGEKGEPYNEDDVPDATNIYGRTKLLGEIGVREECDKHFILRVAWLFSDAGGDYLDTVVKAVQNDDEFACITPRRACPTYTREIAERVCEIIQIEKYGVYHLVSSSDCSQEEMVEEVMNLIGRRIKLLPIPSSNNNVLRPKDTRLNCQKLASIAIKPMPSWQNSIADCLINRGVLKKRK